MEPELEQQAAAGDLRSQLALARLLETQGQHPIARGWYARAAQGGDPAALAGLAASLLSVPPYEIESGLRFMRAAAEQGDPQALHVCSALAGHDATLPDNWNVALEFLAAAAERGHAVARAELALLAHDTSGSQDWKALRSRVDVARWLTPPKARSISRAPRIAVLEQFAAPEVCDWLVERARGRAGRAKVYDPATGQGTVKEHRTNSAANFDMSQWDLPLVFLRTRIAQAIGLPAHCLEHPMVLHYEPGEEFAPHFDFLDPQMPGLRREILTKGQRVATFLVYLNDDYEGAETEFTELGLRHRGRKGDALLFWNLDAAGLPDRRTRHAGRAPIAGEKWVLSQWIREDKPAAHHTLAVNPG